MKNIYNVHIYREMRLVYSGIDANSHEEAAAIARDNLTSDADAIDDCDGETFAALVDVQGDEDYGHSRTIDFEGERERKAVPKMQAALRAFIEADEMAEECQEWKWENLAHAFALARDALAEATASSPPSQPPTTLKLTGELAGRMRNPSRDVVYSPHAFSSVENDSDVQWTHPDEHYVIAFDRASETFTGHYYDWDDEQQDWVDTETMTAEQIRACIERNHLIFAR